MLSSATAHASGRAALDLLALLVRSTNIYLLYSYKSTNRAFGAIRDSALVRRAVLDLLALLVQKYKY